jgi:hypothetical protein
LVIICRSNGYALLLLPSQLLFLVAFLPLLVSLLTLKNLIIFVSFYIFIISVCYNI